MGEQCSLCSRAVEASGVTDEQDVLYCSAGCRTVSETLAPVSEDSDAAEPAADMEAPDTAFLHVDGMHCSTCEQFLETLAGKREGVVGAQASYVTETIRVGYDPSEITVEELCDALSRVGYKVTPRDELSTVADHQNRRTDDRHLDDLLGFRYAAGVLFGLFLLLPYIVVFYPAQVPGMMEEMNLFGTGPGPGTAIFMLPAFMGLTSVVLFFTGLPVLRGAYVSLRMRQPNTDLLVTITIVSAYVYGTLAFFAGDIRVFYDLTIVIASVVVAAIYYESLVKQRAVDRLTKLTVSEVTDTRLYDDDGTTTEIPVEELEPGDSVLVTEGERIPVDGELETGQCTVDEAVVTGESLPVRKERGDPLVGGSVVVENRAVLAVGDPPTSSLDTLTSAVWDLQSVTHGLQRRSDRIATVVVPGLAVLALTVAVLVGILGSGLTGAVFAGLATLLVCCPWTVGLSTPLSVATSIEAGLERGIIVFDESIFERLRETDIVVFDKTGTLTTGEMDLLVAEAPEELLSRVATLEEHASHPAASVIAEEFGVRTDGGTEAVGGDGSQASRLSNVRTHATGIEGTFDGSTLLVGNLDLFVDQGWTVDSEIEGRANTHRENGHLPVIVGEDGHAEGLIVLGDEPRADWAETMDSLHDRGIESVVLTGDDREAAAQFESHDGVRHVFAGVSPEGKTETIRRLRTEGHVTMVGDGTNDGPALAAADLGIAISSGTALAAEAADIAILDDDLSTVETAFDLADSARKRLYQNTGVGLLYNAMAIAVALLGILNPLTAMVATVLSATLIGLNSARSLL